MSHPAPSRTAHERFCTTEGWDMMRSATCKRNEHHDTCELTVPSGDLVRTRVSRPAARDNYGPTTWAHILRDQLDVTEQEFWDCADRGVIPSRGEASASTPRGAPTRVLYQLKHRVGLTDSEIAALSRDEAIERLNEFRTTGR